MTPKAAKAATATVDPTDPDVRPADLDLTPETLLAMHRDMTRARMFDERAWALYRMGRVPVVLPCSGQEGTQVGYAYAVRSGEDIVRPYYRDTAAMLALGCSPQLLMLNLFAREADVQSRGRQFPAHWSMPELKIPTNSSPVGNQWSQAVGAALACRIRREPYVSLVCGGEGSTNRGEFYEACNFAATRHLPVVFLIQNNGYAISVPYARQISVPHVADRARGYGMPGITVDGQDVLAVYRTVKEAVERARQGGGPSLVECITYRYLPHSSTDDDRRYRTRKEVEEWRRTRDPIQLFKRHLIAEGLWTEAQDHALRVQAQQEIDEAIEYAEQAPSPKAEELTTFLFAEAEQ